MCRRCLGEGSAGFVDRIDDGDIRRRLKADDVFLVFDLSIARAVPVEVVDGDLRHDGDVRGPVHLAEVVEHKTGQFEKHEIIAADSDRVHRGEDLPMFPPSHIFRGVVRRISPSMAGS